MLLVNINARASALDATALATQLVDALAKRGVGRLLLAGSMSMRAPSGTLKRGSDAEPGQEDLYVAGDVAVKGAGALPPSAQLGDDLACALVLVAKLEGIPVALLACHGHSMRGPDPAGDKTLQVCAPPATKAPPNL
jgi:hypothetical protein